MQPKYLMVVSAVVSAIVGIACVVGARPLYSYVGAMGPALILQVLGSVLIGIAVLNWFARNAREGEALRAIILANFVFNTTSFVLSLYALLSGSLTVGPLSLITIGVPLMLALGFAYFQFVSPVESVANMRQ